MNNGEPLRLMTLKTIASVYATTSEVRCRVVLQDAEDEHVPALTVLVSGLAEDALLPEAVAPQRVGAQTIVFVHFGLDAPKPQHVDPIVRDQLAGLHTKSSTDRLRVG